MKLITAASFQDPCKRHYRDLNNFHCLRFSSFKTFCSLSLIKKNCMVTTISILTFLKILIFYSILSTELAFEKNLPITFYNKISPQINKNEYLTEFKRMSREYSVPEYFASQQKRMYTFRLTSLNNTVIITQSWEARLFLKTNSISKQLSESTLSTNKTFIFMIAACKTNFRSFKTRCSTVHLDFVTILD